MCYTRAMGSVADDRWHVRMAPGEVKVLTLEQIDDLFRLEMIDGDTLVRQDGTENWQPLRVVAGLDDEASVAVGSALPPPPPAPLPPPAQSAPAPLSPPSEAAPFVHSPSFLPPPPSAPVRSAPPPAPLPSVAPPVVKPAPPLLTPAPPVVKPAPPVLRLEPPVVTSFAPLALMSPVPPSRPSRVESLLIGLAALLGLLVALQRNGALAALCASAGQGAAYGKLEAAWGGPGFGTPRAVDALVSKTRSLPAR